MKKSIRKQIAVIFIALFTCMLLLSIVINSQFLENYYVRNKQATLMEVYDVINEASDMNALTSEKTRVKLEDLVESANMTFVIIDQANNQTLTATPNDAKTQEMVSQLMGYLFNRIQINGKVYEKDYVSVYMYN